MYYTGIFPTIPLAQVYNNNRNLFIGSPSTRLLQSGAFGRFVNLIRALTWNRGIRRAHISPSGRVHSQACCALLAYAWGLF